VAQRGEDQEWFLERLEQRSHRHQDPGFDGTRRGRVASLRSDFGCDKQRQYRFEVFTAESRYWIETFPRDTDFTTKTHFTVHLKP
jgi:hypothetical protein